MPPGFSDDFQYYLPASEDSIKAAISSGMVVLDTNVLLSTYRFAVTARAELINVLEKLADRIWIPHQVALEFHRNRLEVISDQGAAYKQVLAELRATQSKLIDQLSEKVHWLANRTGISDRRRASLLNSVERCLQSAIHTVEELEAEHGTFDILGSDDILSQLQRILNHKVGEPFAEQDYLEAIAEAERRAKEGLPPGYKDSDKRHPHGDYFIWRQSLAEAAKRDVNFLVFVTNDSKEDWYRILKGRSVGPRPELAEEAWEQAGARLVMLSINQLLAKAKRYLGASVSSETIRQAETLPPPLRYERHDMALGAIMEELDRDLAKARVDFEEANIRVSDSRVKREMMSHALAKARNTNDPELVRTQEHQIEEADRALHEALNNRTSALDKIDVIRARRDGVLEMLQRMGHNITGQDARPDNGQAR